MAIIGEMSGVSLDDAVYRTGNEGGGNRLQIETVTHCCERVFDEALKRFVASHDCVNVNIVRYDKLQGYKAIIMYMAPHSNSENKALQNVADAYSDGIERLKRYINRDDLSYDVGRIVLEVNDIISDIEQTAREAAREYDI